MGGTPDYANQACGPASPRPIPLVAVARNGRGLVSISFFFGLWGGGGGGDYSLVICHIV